MPKGHPGREHGTWSCYTGGCRCQPCIEAMRLYRRAYDRSRGVQPAEIVHAPQHGTRSRYRKGCRDECCKQAERQYRARYRATHTNGDRH